MKSLVDFRSETRFLRADWGAGVSRSPFEVKKTRAARTTVDSLYSTGESRIEGAPVHFLSGWHGVTRRPLRISADSGATNEARLWQRVRTSGVAPPASVAFVIHVPLL
jgi:hypothetical protein